MEGSQERREARFDALGILLRASGSPATQERVSARFHADFVLPLARLLRGRDAELRAALIASYLIGLATMKHALGSPLLGAATQRKAVASVGRGDPGLRGRIVLQPVEADQRRVLQQHDGLAVLDLAAGDHR